MIACSNRAKSNMYIKSVYIQATSIPATITSLTHHVTISSAQTPADKHADWKCAHAESSSQM